MQVIARVVAVHFGPLLSDTMRNILHSGGASDSVDDV
jgi:hypothetical protein